MHTGATCYVLMYGSQLPLIVFLDIIIMTIVSIKMASLPPLLSIHKLKRARSSFLFSDPTKKITKGPNFAPKQSNLSIYLSKYNCLNLISIVVIFLNIENISMFFLWNLFYSIKNCLHNWEKWIFPLKFHNQTFEMKPLPSVYHPHPPVCSLFHFQIRATGNT